jgi:hypothetical protein
VGCETELADAIFDRLLRLRGDVGRKDDEHP